MNSINDLISWFNTNCKDGVVVALSGGVDSSLVAYAAKEVMNEKALAVIADYKTFTKDELINAIKVAREIGINYKVIEYNELDNEKFVINDQYRCYYCREELAKYLVEIAKSYNYSLIVDGTNIDDLSDIRYGIKALREHGIRSPLAELSITKSMVRTMAKMINLSVYDKPSNSCLASRIERGIAITSDLLARVEAAESIVKSITSAKIVRVRVHHDLARIEVSKDERYLLFNTERLDEIDKRLKSIGFKFVTIDAMGYKSGSLNIIS